MQENYTCKSAVSPPRKTHGSCSPLINVSFQPFENPIPRHRIVFNKSRNAGVKFARYMCFISIGLHCWASILLKFLTCKGTIRVEISFFFLEYFYTPYQWEYEKKNDSSNRITKVHQFL